jgi:hypothetical protein
MQNSAATKYLGKRVRMTGLIKCKDVAYWCGLWLRIDGKNKGQSLSFDNMHDGKSDRSINGTSDWKSYDIVLDVPEKATNMAYGALLVGTGQMWFDNLKFEEVGNEVPVTGINKNKENNSEPENLDFEK